MLVLAVPWSFALANGAFEADPLRAEGFEQFLQEDNYPSAFVDEVGLPQGATRVFHDGESVVGVFIPGTAYEVFDGLASDLQNKGWLLVESGIDHAGSFIKQTGNLQWLYLECIESEGITSVIYRF